HTAERLKLDGATAHALRLLVENHLLMAQVSQRRDLEDQNVIRNYAAQMQTRENVMMLTLLTFSDARGTSDQLWNSFKDSLLWTLFSKTMDMLAGKDFRAVQAKQIELLKEEVRSMLPSTFSQDEIEAHFST